MSSEATRRGILFIVSAPSGTGKTTLVERAVQCVPRLRMSRSYTSRAMRAGEKDGVDYNFISREIFQQMVQRGEFLEWADVFGHLYGTCAADTEGHLAAGHDRNGLRVAAGCPVNVVQVHDLPGGPVLLLANEFFDALPVRHYVKTMQGWRERLVGLDVAGERLPVGEAVGESDRLARRDLLRLAVRRELGEERHEVGAGERGLGHGALAFGEGEDRSRPLGETQLFRAALDKRA